MNKSLKLINTKTFQMSSLIQKIDRASAEAEASCTNILHRVCTVARDMVNELSSAINQWIKSFKAGITHTNTQCSYLLGSTQIQAPQQPQAAALLDDNSAFLACFEQEHGTMHPFFYTCKFEDGMKLARDELKFMFMYLHSPRHPFVHSFCRETLCCEAVVQFLDANFVCWGAVAEWGEGVHMSSTLRPKAFPFCALITLSADNSISVLQQIEGPVSADELVEILTRVIEEQGTAFGHLRPESVGKVSIDMELRQDHDVAAALLASLETDKEKDHANSSQSPLQAEAQSKYGQDTNISSLAKHEQNSTLKPPVETESDTTAYGEEGEITKILIRFPDGNKREQSFKSTDKIKQLYWFIDSLAIPSLGNYQLVSGMPRRVYGVEEMEMSLENADLHPRASLFLEPL